MLNEKPHRGGVVPVEALLHCAVAQIKMQVTMAVILLKHSYGIKGNILLPAPTGISQGQMLDWTWYGR